jgi:hypothetical protein
MRFIPGHAPVRTAFYCHPWLSIFIKSGWVTGTLGTDAASKSPNFSIIAGYFASCFTLLKISANKVLGFFLCSETII